MYDYFEYNNTIYKFYCIGPHPNYVRKQRVNNSLNDWFINYKHVTNNVTVSDAEIDTTKTKDTENLGGIDLTVPTFDGKYSYEKSEKGPDYVSVLMHPMEYRSFAVFCPEVELNQPYYNNILTGEEVVSRQVTKNAYLTRDNRRYSFTETSTVSTQSSKCKAINVPENVSLLTIEHSHKTGDDYIRRSK